ncbi:unnamed protein product [Caenorhabditis angaria]|uniref:7TM GPCR serpentine receptor class x (Srx) domain-containing protein n=1 Tax=Caenorhabditis angaria TaxID=860376 RepID=A0A9P1N6L8_9PELO|nr:unnamed protein product [Caenorhabditis angaria]
MFSELVYQSADEYIQTWEDILASALVVISCLIGLLMVILAIYGCIKIPSMRISPFGYLTKHQLISQGLAAINSGSFFLAVLLDFKVVIYHSNIFGLFITILLPSILLIYFAISLNRFLALATPIYYSTLFGIKTRKFYILFAWITPIIYMSILFIQYDCSYKFYHYGWIFIEKPSEICGAKLSYQMVISQGLLCLTMLFLDCATIVMLVFFKDRIVKSKSPIIRRREINFAQQVIIQGFVFTMHAFWYIYGNQWIPGTSENWRIFWTSTFSSNLLHIFDCGIIFIFNSEFSNWIRNLKRKSRVVSITVNHS